MKWLTHKTGDVRDRVVFAWKPQKCADGFTRRFVFLNVREEYNESIHDGDGEYSEGWEAKRWTPLKADPEAEAIAAAAQAVRDSRPKKTYTFTFFGGFPSISFGTPTVEGDEWKSGGDTDKSDEDQDDA